MNQPSQRFRHIPPELRRSIEGLNEFQEPVEVPVTGRTTAEPEEPMPDVMVRSVWCRGWFDSQLPYSALAVIAIKLLLYFHNAAFPAKVFQTVVSVLLPALILLSVYWRKFRLFQILVSLLMALSIASVVIPSPVPKS